MYPLVGRERHGDPAAPSLADRILDDGADAFVDPPIGWDLHTYVTEALSSGWPEALRSEADRARDRWLTGYVDHLATREAPALGVVRDPLRLRRYLQAIAANTAGVPAHKLLYDSAGIGREAARRSRGPARRRSRPPGGNRAGRAGRPRRGGRTPQRW
ncbi:hypothetical protein [Parafrankia sp. FMc2]|uniref:hypothetical protein n=1 Tax=Parafrankia sp. FMc2 TaxID=3233196 RepID=UPI0034D6B0AC